MLLSEEMASINDKEAVTRVIAHETAHMVRFNGLHVINVLFYFKKNFVNKFLSITLYVYVCVRMSR